MLQLARIAGELPREFVRLRLAAEAEGYRHMTRLEVDFISGVQRFEHEDEALLAAFLDGELVGIGGLTREPGAPLGAALRMRRLYVLPGARGRGIATMITSALLNEALSSVRLVTVHAGSSDAARFWEARGYAAVEGRPWSHQFVQT
jgi:GNAT superfamily N-acetyltransferase